MWNKRERELVEAGEKATTLCDVLHTRPVGTFACRHSPNSYTCEPCGCCSASKCQQGSTGVSKQQPAQVRTGLQAIPATAFC